MRIDHAFPSNYLRSGDVPDNSTLELTMTHVAIEKIGDDEKPVLFFAEDKKGLVLNKTNSNNITTLYGPETENWAGKKVTLFTAMVDFRGSAVEAIRIKGPETTDDQAQVEPSGTTGELSLTKTDIIDAFRTRDQSNEWMGKVVKSFCNEFKYNTFDDLPSAMRNQLYARINAGKLDEQVETESVKDIPF
jgi:hypothetical protein